MVRVPTDDRLVDGRVDGAVVGLESRWCTLAADDPLARRRQLRLAVRTRLTLGGAPATSR